MELVIEGQSIKTTELPSYLREHCKLGSHYGQLEAERAINDLAASFFVWHVTFPPVQATSLLAWLQIAVQ